MCSKSSRFAWQNTPVTNVQFEAFLDAEDGYQNEHWWQGRKQSEATTLSSRSEANCPREMVSWNEAVAFCRWLGHRTGSRIRLPTEWEWQQAVMGGDPTCVYPWLGEWDAARCNSREGGLYYTTPVGIFPSGVSRYGVMDMAGNVWEWCLNKFEHPERSQSMVLDSVNGQRVMRGGSWNTTKEIIQASFQSGYFPENPTNIGVGFRLAQDID